MNIVFDTKLFSVETIKRALYRFGDRYAFDLTMSEGCLVISLPANRSLTETSDDIAAKVKAAVIDQDLRDALTLQTQNIRTLILAHAFSNTGAVKE